jgi:hypothetical protein
MNPQVFAASAAVLVVTIAVAILMVVAWRPTLHCLPGYTAYVMHVQFESLDKKSYVVTRTTCMRDIE